MALANTFGMHANKSTKKTQQAGERTQDPNYRIYDRTGGGVTQDIYAESLEDAIEQGRAWIEDGDWSGIGRVEDEDGSVRYETHALECSVGEIVYAPDVSSIESLDGVHDVTVTDGVVIAEIDQEQRERIASALDARLSRISDPDADGMIRVAVCMDHPPQIIDEDATNDADTHDCSGEYAPAMPDCEVSLPESEQSCDTDDQGHILESPEFLGGCRENPGVWSTGGTSFRFASVCRLCGKYKSETTPGCQRNPDEPLSTVTISDRDERSEKWLKALHEEDGWLPAWLAEYLDCMPTTRMTLEQAREYVAGHDDSDDLDDDDLENAFAAIHSRRADDDDRQAGLWSLLCAACPQDEEDAE